MNMAKLGIVSCAVNDLDGRKIFNKIKKMRKSLYTLCVIRLICWRRKIIAKSLLVHRNHGVMDCWGSINYGGTRQALAHGFEQADCCGCRRIQGFDLARHRNGDGMGGTG